VFYQAEQGVARGQHSPAQLRVVQPLQLPHHGVPVPVQAGLQAFLLTAGVGHPLNHDSISSFRRVTRAYGGRRVGRRLRLALPNRDLSQFSHGLSGRYGTMAPMPDIRQDAGLRIRTPAHWPDRLH
jgi:hypothetical protein